MSNGPREPEMLHLMSASLLVDGALRAGIVSVLDGRVAAILTEDGVGGDGSAVPLPGGEMQDVGDAPITPAPLDLHFHGCGGFAVPPGDPPLGMEQALADECSEAGWDWPGVPAMYEYVAALPSWTSGARPDNLLEHVELASRMLREAAGCRGMRLEGVFLNPALRGVWPSEGLAAPDAALFEELVWAASDAGVPLLVVDVAPELPGAEALIERACELGVVASIAHTDASWDVARRAIDAGATLATHTFNAMGGFHHRAPGVVGAVLTDERVACELVCDGVHLHPGAVALAAGAARGRIVAVSDASPYALCTTGGTWLGTELVCQDGRVATRDGALAGSAQVLTAAPDVLHEAGLGPVEVLRAMTTTPRRVLEPSRPDGLQVGDRVWVCGDFLKGLERGGDRPVHSGHG